MTTQEGEPSGDRSIWSKEPGAETETLQYNPVSARRADDLAEGLTRENHTDVRIGPVVSEEQLEKMGY